MIYEENFTLYLLINFHINPSWLRRILLIIADLAQKGYFKRSCNVNVSIYPVPVRENSFTIKSDKDISFVKITNIIGQDIFRVQYNDPQQLIKSFLKIPKEECIWLLLFSVRKQE